MTCLRSHSQEVRKAGITTQTGDSSAWVVTTVPHCLSALIWATLSLQLGTYVCFPKLYWKAIFGKLILIFHLNLSMTLEWKGRPSLWASMTPSTQPEAGTFPDLEALCSMQHWAVCVCARGCACMHGCEHGHMHGVCVGAWPSWRDHAALCWPRGVFHPRREQA